MRGELGIRLDVPEIAVGAGGDRVNGEVAGIWNSVTIPLRVIRAILLEANRLGEPKVAVRAGGDTPKGGEHGNSVMVPAGVIRPT